MEADGKDDAQELMEYGPGGGAAAGGPGGWIKPEEMSLINNKREKGGVDASHGRERKDKRAREERMGSKSIYTEFFFKKPGFFSKP
jgi:hypothetical protein